MSLVQTLAFSCLNPPPPTPHLGPNISLSQLSHISSESLQPIAHLMEEEAEEVFISLFNVYPCIYTEYYNLCTYRILTTLQMASLLLWIHLTAADKEILGTLVSTRNNTTESKSINCFIQ